MSHKPENEIQGRHRIFKRHGELFTYVIEMSPTSWKLGFWSDADNSKKGVVDIWIESYKPVMSIDYQSRKIAKNLLFKADIEMWLREQGHEVITNFTPEEFITEWMQRDTRISLTGRWIQFEANPLVEAIWKLGDR